MDVILFGPPGAGKGTQAAAVSKHLGVPQVATGDIFRKHLKEGTELGQLAQRYMNDGQLVPDQVVCDIVASRLEEPDCQGGVLLDGFPRTVPQVELLDGWLRDHDRNIDVVVNIQVDDSEVLERITGRRTCLSDGSTFHVKFNPPTKSGVCDKCGGGLVQREDDTEEKVSERLKAYHEQTEPVLAWLRSHDKRVLEIDGAQGIDDVRTEIISGLDDVAG